MEEGALPVVQLVIQGIAVIVRRVCWVQLTPEVKQFLETAGPGVERSVAARVAQMADAVFPPQPEQDLVPLAVLNGALVSPRGAEVLPPHARTTVWHAEPPD